MEVNAKEQKSNLERQYVNVYENEKEGNEGRDDIEVACDDDDDEVIDLFTGTAHNSNGSRIKIVREIVMENCRERAQLTAKDLNGNGAAERRKRRKPRKRIDSSQFKLSENCGESVVDNRLKSEKELFR